MLDSTARLSPPYARFASLCFAISPTSGRSDSANRRWHDDARLFVAITRRFEYDCCPQPPQQRRIAEILSTLDETIEQTEALIAKYQQIKAGLMHDLFTRGVTPDGKLRPTRAEAPQLYKESPLGWIPKEWELYSSAIA